MSVILFAAAFALGGAAATLVFYLKTRGPRKEVVLTESTNQQPEYPLPPNRHKFRVVYYTQQGARARDIFSEVEEELSRRADYQELVEFWHFGDVRNRTYGVKP